MSVMSSLVSDTIWVIDDLVECSVKVQARNLQCCLQQSTGLGGQTRSKIKIKCFRRIWNVSSSEKTKNKCSIWPTWFGTWLKQGSLYQSKQCTIVGWKSLKFYHRFPIDLHQVWFPPKLGPISQGCRFVPYPFSETKPQMVPTDPKYWFPGFGFDSGPNLPLCLMIPVKLPAG